MKPPKAGPLTAGAGVGTGIGSATAPDKKDEARRTIAAMRGNIFICQRGSEELKV